MKTYYGILLLIVALLLTYLCFNNTREFQFVNWYDQEQIVNNEHINTLNFNSVKTYFSSFYSGMYQPFTTLSFAIDHAIYGGKNPSGFHLTSLLMHLINIILLFILMRKLEFDDFQSFILVLLFAVHPYQVESVSWVSARSTLLFSMFYLCALIFYANFAETRKSSSIVHAFVFFLLALFSNPAAASFVLFIPLLEWYYHPRINARTWLRFAFFSIPGVIFMVLTHFSRSVAGQFFVTNESETGFFQNLGYSLWSVVLYAYYLFIPSTQNAFRAYPEFSVWMYILPLVILATLVYAFVRFKKQRRIFLISLGIFLIPLFVYLKIFPWSGHMMADRYMYLSVPGLFILPVCFVSLLLKKYTKKLLQLIAVAMFVIVFSVYFAKSMAMTFTWQDSVSLWTNVIENNPEHHIGYYNRALAFRDKGRHFEAIADLDRVIEYQPSNTDAYLARGSLFNLVESFGRAIDDFTTVIQLSGEHYYAYFNRGNAYYNKNDFLNALKDYKSFTSYVPMHEDASFRSILCMIELNYSLEEIFNELEVFIGKFPENPDGYYLRGLILINGAPEEACRDFRKSADLGNSEAKKIVLRECM